MKSAPVTVFEMSHSFRIILQNQRQEEYIRPIKRLLFRNLPVQGLLNVPYRKIQEIGKCLL